MKSKVLATLIPALALLAASSAAIGQTLDSGGTASLKGNYFFRYVALSNISQAGAAGGARSLAGTITFDGAGKYSLNAQSYDSAAGANQAFTATGVYLVTSSGLAYLDNPIDNTSTIYGTFSQPVVLGSATEDNYEDMFVAIQAPTGQVTNGSLTGNYQAGSFEFQGGSTSNVRQAAFLLNANGSGGFSTITVNGSAGNAGNSTLTQSISGATYTFASNGNGTANFPVGSAGTSGTLVSGAKSLYLSADGNYILGGSTNGYDLIFGFKALASSGSNALANGTYFAAGMDADLSSLSSGINLDSYYGSLNANGQGTAIWHERLNPQLFATYDFIFDAYTTYSAAGLSQDSVSSLFLSANGQAQLLIGKAPQYSIAIAVKAPAYTPTGSVWINPLGVLNAANYAPITAPYAPGELVNIYGAFNGVTTRSASAPFPTTLGGVQVSVNGRPAPIYAVSASQLSVLLPFGTTEGAATFQVTVNNVKSNTVSYFADTSSPAAYTFNQNGVGPSAVLHANFTPVTTSSPAKPGETVLLFLNGLGTVTPPVADGAPGPSNPLSTVDDTSLQIFLNFNDEAKVTFAGLAPGFAALYQVNFTIPTTEPSGNLYIGISTANAYAESSTVAVSSATGSSATLETVKHRVSRRVKPGPRVTNAMRHASPDRAGRQ